MGHLVGQDSVQGCVREFCSTLSDQEPSGAKAGRIEIIGIEYGEIQKANLVVEW